jgi:hypothetical protein
MPGHIEGSTAEHFSAVGKTIDKDFTEEGDRS